MFRRFVNYFKKRRSNKHISDLLKSGCTKIAIRVLIHETGALLLDVLSRNGNIIEHLQSDFDYSKFKTDRKTSFKHVYMIPSVEAKFTNDADIVFNQTDIASFTIIKDNYTKRKGTVIHV